MIPLIQKSKKLDILAVAAHPDDAEIGCGGILARYAREGKQVGVIDVTDGEPTPFTENREERLEEAKKSAEILGLSVREVLDLPNRKLFDNFEARIALAKRIRYYQPKILLGMGGMTPHDSPDHYQSQLITEGAIFYARLSKWEEYFGDVPIYRVRNYFYYATMRESPNPEIMLPRFIIDTSEDYVTKVLALKAYASQFRADKKSQGIIHWIDAMGRFYGKQIDAEYGELLFSPKALEFNLDLYL